MGQADRYQESSEGEPPQARVAGGLWAVVEVQVVRAKPADRVVIAAEDAHPSAPEA